MRRTGEKLHCDPARSMCGIARNEGLAKSTIVRMVKEDLRPAGPRFLKTPSVSFHGCNNYCVPKVASSVLNIICLRDTLNSHYNFS